MCCLGSTMALLYIGYSRKNTFSWENNIFEAIFLMSGTKNIIFGTLKIGQNDLEIPNLEFENYGFLENQVFLPTEQAGTNIC